MSNFSTGNFPSLQKSTNSGISTRGLAEPRYEPRIVFTSETKESAEIENISEAGGKPTVTVVPPRLVASYAAFKLSALPAHSIATNTPPGRCSRKFSLGSKAKSAPRLSASSLFDATGSIAKMGDAFEITAPIRADNPTPPRPHTPRDCPGFACAEFLTAPIPVRRAQPNSAAISKGMSSGSFISERSSRTAYWL